MRRAGPGLPPGVRLLVRLSTPARHRDALEEELARELKRVLREEGRAAWLRALLGELRGVVWHGLRDRLREGRPWGHPLIRGVEMDVRVTLRRFRASPAFTASGATTLALALVLVGAVFAVVDAVLLRPPPYGEPDRLVALWQTGRGSVEPTTVAPGNVVELEREARTLEGVAWFNGWVPSLTGSGDAVRVSGSVASVDLFDVLGVRPALGPGFGPEHAAAGGAPAARVVVLSHPLWVRQFGSDPDVVGRSITLNDASYEVVGVMPAGFRHPRTFLGLDPAELWAPISLGPTAEERDQRFLHVVARLAPGATLEDARAEMRVLGASLARSHPKANGGRTVLVRRVDAQLFGEQRPVVVLLFGAALLVLLVACVNMANLLLAQSLGRRREFAVRTALGSGRGAVVRQLMVEGLLLGALGGVLGVVLCTVAGGALRAWIGPYVGALAEVRFDARVALFTLCLALLSGLALGVPPALHLLRSGTMHALGARWTTVRGSRAQTRLVAVETALTVVLLVGAGLLGRGLLRLFQVSPGFAVERTLFFEVRPPFDGYEDGAEVAEFYRALQAALEARPEIEATALVSDLPLTSENRSTAFTVPASTRPADEVEAEYHHVSPRYFRVAGVRLLEGREFNDSDTGEAPFVAVVDRILARRVWGERSPVGERIHLVDADVDALVVGVAESTVDDALDGPLEPRFYFPVAQSGQRTLHVVARTTGPAAEALGLVRGVVARVDGRVPVSGLSTMERHVGASLSLPRGMTWLGGLFGGVALLLAAVGVFGVMAQRVAARSREMGVRAALGADRSSLVGLVVGDAVRVAGAGLSAGLLPAVLVGQLLARQLPSVPSWDPGVLLAATSAVAGAAFLAAWLPARRAARTDPSLALRSE